MKQSKLHSLYEQFVQAGIKFFTAMAVWAFIATPILGIPFDLRVNFMITFIFMCNSIIVGYMIRRGFNWWHHRKATKYSWGYK